MARCPNCRRNFRVLEDENPADHGCPNCGYGQDWPLCAWCQDRLDNEDHYPYCSEECGVKAELDGE